MIDKAQIRALLGRYREDEYKAFNKVKELRGSASDAELAAALWELVREGCDELTGSGSAFWCLMLRSGTDYNGEDFLRLWRGIAAAYPDGSKKTSWGATHCWSSGDMPGIPSNLLRELEVRGKDPDFARPLVEGWSSMPAPYDLGLLFMLGSCGAVPVDALPPKLLKTAARAFLNNDNSSRPTWVMMAPWSAEVWDQALVDVALDGAGWVIESHTAVRAIAATASIDTMMALVGRIDYYGAYREPLETAVAISKAAGDARGALESQIEAIGAAITPPSWQGKTFPAFFVGFAYLSLCQREGTVPPESQDVFWEALVENMVVGWSGSNFDKYTAELRALLSVLPAERLGPMLVKATGPRWELYGAAPTEAVARRVVDELDAFKGYDYQVRELVAPGVVALGVGAIPVYTEALGRSKPVGNRQVLVEALGVTGHPDAAPGLAVALGDKSKGVREEAVARLLALPDKDAVLAALAEPLGSRRKDARVGAATVLAGMSGHAGAYAMATEALTGEKVEAVRELLGRVAPPEGEGGGSSLEALIQALDDSDGARWDKLTDEGAELYRAYFALMERRANGTSSNTYGNCYEHWLKVVAHFRDEAELRELAVALAANFSVWGGQNYLDKLGEIFDGVGALVSAQVAAGRWGRTPGSGNHRYSLSLEHILNWLMVKALDHATPALIFGLGDKRKGIFTACVERLVRRADDAAVMEEIAGLLASDQPRVREGAAAVLEGAGYSRALTRVREALAAESNRAARCALESAEVALAASALDVSAFEPGAAGDEALDRALAGLPGDVPLELSKLPAVHWASGAALSEGAMGWLVLALTREASDRADEQLRLVRARLRDEDCHRLCDAMMAMAPTVDRGWGLFIQPVIGSPQVLDALGADLERQASSQRTSWGSDGVDAMVRADSDEAIRWLDHWHRRTKRDALRWRAASGLTEMATARGIDVEELIDGAMSRFGFDDAGRREVDYGGRPMIFLLEPGGRIVIQDEAGRTLKALPSPRKDDDAAAAARVKAELAMMKKEIGRILKAQAERLEVAMAWGRRWEVPVWRQRFLHHPVMRGLACGLVYAHLGDDDARTPFIFDERGQTLGADLQPWALPDEGHVCVEHPIHLGRAARERFDEFLLENAQAQPFSQLLRQTFSSADMDAGISRYLVEMEMVTEAGFFRGLRRANYERGPREDAGLIHSCDKRYGPWIVAFGHTGVSPEVMDNGRAEIELQNISVHGPGGDTALDALPPELFSEIVRDIHLIMGAGGI